VEAKDVPWQETLQSCIHTKQTSSGEAIKVQQSGARCNGCELESNLWICLTCGNLACGREQYGTNIKGNSHAVAHYKSTSHPVAVKLGSITPDSADVYCYQCDDMVLCSDLKPQLARFGINLDTTQKTEQTVGEMVSANIFAIISDGLSSLLESGTKFEL